MDIKGIKYISPTFDSSGYGQASRGYILALHKKGIPITLDPVSFEGWKTDLGESGKILESLIDIDINYNIVIVHLTPEFWKNKIELDKINLGYTVWETDRLHPKWMGYINNTVHGVMVGCDWNIDVFKNSGIKVPIFSVPHGIDFDEFQSLEPYQIAGVKEDAFKFYDVFQFTERKHPVALIKSYWHAFQNNENVALILKTYKNDFTSEEKTKVKDIVKKLKNVTPMESYPPVYLILDQLSRQEVLGVHKTGDCFVSLDRGEGFGLCGFEAGAFGNPIIVTGIGGALEYAKPDNSYLVDYSLTPVSGMPWSSSINSIVCTNRGYKKINHLTKNDEVINKNGNVKNIIKLGHRDLIEGERMHALEYMSMYEELEVTNNHKLYIVDKDNKIEKKKVENIQIGDYLYIPSLKTVIYNEKIDLYKYTHSNRWTCEGDRLFCRQSNKGYLSVKRFIPLSNDLFFLVGLYLAEGCVYKDRGVLSFSFNSNEKDTLVNKCTNLLISVFDIDKNKIHIRYYDDRDGCEITVDNLAIANFFKDMFGTGSHYKFIPIEWKLNNVKSFRENIIRGYWLGDGHIRKFREVNGKKIFSRECVASTASMSLVLDLRDLLISLDILPSLTKNIRKDGRISYIISVNNLIFDSLLDVPYRNKSNSSFHYYKLDNGGFAVRVKSNKVIKEFNGQVYSIAVECDEDESKEDGGSYILNSIASSNSPWYLGDQMWAEPDCGHAVSLLRHVYENQDESKEKGKLLRKYIKDNFSWDKVADKMIEVIHKM